MTLSTVIAHFECAVATYIKFHFVCFCTTLGHLSNTFGWRVMCQHIHSRSQVQVATRAFSTLRCGENLRGKICDPVILVKSSILAGDSWKIWCKVQKRSQIPSCCLEAGLERIVNYLQAATANVDQSLAIGLVHRCHQILVERPVDVWTIHLQLDHSGHVEQVTLLHEGFHHQSSAWPRNAIVK